MARLVTITFTSAVPVHNNNSFAFVKASNRRRVAFVTPLGVSHACSRVCTDHRRDERDKCLSEGAAKSTIDAFSLTGSV